MNMLTYEMPTKCYIGTDVISNFGEVIKKYGDKTLIVTGRNSSKKNGSFDDVKTLLNKINIDYVVFDSIEENPSLETIEKARIIGIGEGVDFIIGIGGGSPIDASKAIGILIKNIKYTAFNFIGEKNLESLPIIAVPTTAGTGTEVTQYAIVTDNKDKCKKNMGHSVFPKVAFLDPKYMKDMNFDITVSTAVDAFSHLVEAYLNTNANFISDMYCEKGIGIFKKCLIKLIEKELDMDLRENLMMVSMLGGFAIAQVGTSIPHGMGYALTYNKGISHGVANCILYREYLKCFKNQEKVRKIIDILELESIDTLGNYLDEIINLDFRVTEEEIREYSKGMASNKGKLKNHPEAITEEEIFNIYKKSLLK